MTKFAQQIQIFKKNGGHLRTTEALELGIHPRALYAMASEGILERVSRGLYHLKNHRSYTQPDLATITLMIPQGVICLISALAFHNITTQIPHDVDVALKKGAEKPRLAYPPTRFVWLSPEAFESGIEVHKIDGLPFKVYSPEKTVADCFKFRNRVGLDVAIEALKFCRERKRSKASELMKYAKIDRVEKVMKPYLEAIL